MPSKLLNNETFTTEEIELVINAKGAIKEFGLSLINHIQNLLDYLIQIRKDKPFKINYIQTLASPIF